jgi:site-specific DNA-methyltransferase (adenine-specific)
MKNYEHPAMFPEEIPYRLLKLFSYRGDLVLDPFNGSGQTTKVARHLGRRFLGLDVEAKYVKYAQERLKEPLAIRPEQLVAVFEKLGVSVASHVIAEDLPLFGGGNK